VFELYANYTNWTKIFPDIRSVKLLRKEGDKSVLVVEDTQEGPANLTIRAIPPDRIESEISRKSLEGKAIYTFESLSASTTRMNLTFDVSLKGVYRLGTPFAERIIAGVLRKFIFEPLKRAVSENRPPT
jgi:hypothetical protein